ncbi:YbjN domain-containing protein [Leptospira jelokensis]|uniref:YbjN domain-containing protein n=1 Tax=Leptospira jelokensis TaxID=2484931 RepID=A0A4Z1A2L8_9LEPT|nr:YbjN domain-containing protein [Leptospira jelokensis]TGL72461.1 YbjN domain-containing protein [Leptospira jelokensis]
MKSVYKSFLLLFLVFFAIGTYADPMKTKEGETSLKSANLQYKVDKGLLKKLLLEIGYKILSDEDKLLILSYQDFKVGLMSGNDTSIQFYSSFTTDKKNKMDLANRWNQKMRYSRSYTDAEGRLILESDFDYSGGVSEEAIKEFLQKFQILNSQFSTLLILAE